MANEWGIPEIDVHALDSLRRSDEQFVWLDIRETWETEHVRIHDDAVLYVPMSELGQRGPEALPEAAQQKDTYIVVQCHHGVRSAQVAAWLMDQGWTNVVSLTGGVQAWAFQVDPSIGVY